MIKIKSSPENIFLMFLFFFDFNHRSFFKSQFLLNKRWMLFIEVNIGLETLRLVSKLILLGLTSALTSSNWSQLTNPDSMSILKLNVKMAPEMSGFFNWLPLPGDYRNGNRPYLWLKRNLAFLQPLLALVFPVSHAIEVRKYPSLIFRVLVVPQSEAFSIVPRQYHAFSDLFERWPFLLPGAPFVPISGLLEFRVSKLLF